MAVSAEIDGATALHRWPLLPYVAFALVFIVSACAMTASFSARHGGVLYPLDDSYIHLALARTLATSGVWGIDAQHPAAASSSPLWTVLRRIT